VDQENRNLLGEFGSFAGRELFGGNPLPGHQVVAKRGFLGDFAPPLKEGGHPPSRPAMNFGTSVANHRWLVVDSSWKSMTRGVEKVHNQRFCVEKSNGILRVLLSLAP